MSTSRFKARPLIAPYIHANFNMYIWNKIP
jgi:hypothetical protein